MLQDGDVMLGLSNFQQALGVAEHQNGDRDARSQTSETSPPLSTWRNQWRLLKYWRTEVYGCIIARLLEEMKDLREVTIIELCETEFRYSRFRAHECSRCHSISQPVLGCRSVERSVSGER